MDHSFTPAKKVIGDMDHSIFNTPEPQASSTVNRRAHESLPSLPPVIAKTKADKEVPSPAYLLNAIDGMRLLTDQLGSLQEGSENGKRLPIPGGHQIRKAASVAELYNDRRGSVAGDSEANSSLGILKLDEYQGFSEPEDAANLSDLLANFRRDYSFHSMAGKENAQPNSLSHMSLKEVDVSAKGRQPGLDISSKVLNSDVDSSQSRSVQADLRLRLQKHLAQRTIDRSVDSVRLSQMSDYFETSNISADENDVEPFSVNLSKDPIGAYFGNPEQTPSPVSDATFGAANFLTFSGSPAALDSSENFQCADLAMDRLKQDENSWRQYFADLPVVQGTSPSSDSVGGEHLTQNLDLTSMSGIIAGEVTVSSSIMEDVGKRRLSVGEYFKLHTEQLGDRSGDECPNYINSLKSPSKKRPHPPLVNMNTFDVSTDEIPTRDSGLNKTLNSSFPDTLNFSSSVKSDVTNLSKYSVKMEDNPASRSIDLMPPPPPRPRAPPSISGSRASDVRDSLSTRLSMSLSLPRDADNSEMKDLNSSSLSLDSGEKLMDISQMVKVMHEQAAGKKSARQLVDDFFQRCFKPLPDINTEPKVNTQRKSLGSQSCISNGEINPKSMTQKVGVMDSSEHSPSRNQRVKEWISTINDSRGGSVLESDSEGAGSQNQEKSSPDTYRKFTLKSSSVNQRRSVHAITVNQGKGEKLTGSKSEDSDHEHDESVASSFMPPPTRAGNPALNHLRNFSTPKFNGREAPMAGPHQRAASAFVASTHQRSVSAGQFSNKMNLSRKLMDIEAQYGTKELSDGSTSRGSDHQSSKFHRSYDKSVGSKHSSQSSSSTLKSLGQRSISQRSDSDYRDPRPPSNCGSTRSATSCAKSSSKQTDVGSVTSGPLQIDSTHTQLSWASVSPGSSITQTFALRNKSCVRVRLLVSSPNTAFKLQGERGEISSEMMITLHSEETRRIHVVFSPLTVGAVVGKLVISRVATSDSSSVASEDRRLIALYGYGGMAELTVEGASKDRWAQLFLNMCISESDARCEVSDIDISNDALQGVSSFSVRNSGKIPIFVSLQIAGELPFEDCGVYVTPKDISLSPGEVGRILVRFDPVRDILQWLNKNAEDMQLLANIWLSWSELATWQRIRRLHTKYYKSEKSGPLATWGTLYTGDLGVGRELKDNRSSESSLAQAVRRLKVAVLIEREKLNLFDMDATMVFDNLVANETAMFNSPQLNERTLESSEFFDSPILAGPAQDLYSNGNDSPISTVSKHSALETNSLVVVTTVSSPEPQTLFIEFPPTTLGHKSRVSITFQNPSSEKSLVCISDLSNPFSVSTPKFHVPSHSYATMKVFFRPTDSGTHHSTLNVMVNEKSVRIYMLQGEGVHK